MTESGDTIRSPQVPRSEFSYYFNELHIGSTVELTQLQLEEIYCNATNKEANRAPGYIPNDGNSETIAGPIYKTYSNKSERVIADGLVAYLVAQVPWLKALSSMASWVVGILTGWGLDTLFHTVYVGAWITKGYDSNAKVYRYYQSTVYYSNDSFDKPIDVQYGQIAYTSN